jgi:hypothetical protein
MSEIGALNVRIAADTSDLTKGLNQAQSSIENFSGAASKVGTVLKGFFAVLALSEITQFVKQTIDAADALGDLSERTGIAVEDLSRLQYAAQLSDVSLAELQGSINFLTRSMSSATSGTGEASEAFRLLSVSYTTSTGALRDTNAVLMDLADSFAQLEDGPAKNALAMAIFGKSATTMIPLLNQGSEGINKLGQEFDRLGGTITAELSRKSGEFNDNIDRLKVVAGGAAKEIANQLIPYLNQLSEQFLVAEKNALTFFERLSLGLRSPFKNYQQLISDIDKELAQLGDKTSIRFDAERVASLQRQRNYYSEIAQLEALAKANGQYADFIERRFMAGPTRRQAPKLDEEERKKREELLDKQQQDALKVLQEEQKIEQERLAMIENRLNSVRVSLATEREEEMLHYETRLETLREARLNELVTEQEFADAKMRLDEQLQTNLTNIVKQEADKRASIERNAQQMIFNARMGVAQASVELLGMFAGKSKAASVAAIALNKALSIAMIVQNTAVAQMRAMAELGPIAGSAAAAKIGALGKIQIGLVAATGLLQAGMALSGGGQSISTPSMGGASSVGNGSNMGGIGGGTNRPMNNQMITITLVGDVFGREQVRGLIGQINEAISDGAVLRLQ